MAKASLAGPSLRPDDSIRNVAGTALATAALFLTVVAVMLNSSALFYMGTALIATIGASRLQAWLSVRALRFERVAPESVQVGDLVTVQITVWSERKIRRPLVTIQDSLPARLLRADLSPSLPIAPAYDLPIRTQYQFRPLKRGRYRWTGLTVVGTDALGLVTMKKTYETAPATITVLPTPIPVSIDLPSATGWGLSEAESGQSRGAGLEPRGVREYAPGDSLRYVHWRSSARSRQLLVKEFEAGSHAVAAFIIQRTAGSDVGSGVFTSLEVMCGHIAFLADVLLRKGSRVLFPQFEEPSRSTAPHERYQEILELLAAVHADGAEPVGEEALRAARHLTPGSMLFVAVSVPDARLVDAVAELSLRGVQTVAMVYDALAFQRRVGGLASAAEADYVERLRAAGAHPLVMPLEGVR